jgi:hypothetical protein
MRFRETWRFSPIPALLVALVCMGCGGGGKPTSTQTSGIRGQAREGPLAPSGPPGDPLTQIGTAAPLPFAVITVQPPGGGAEVARQTADADGNFEIPLRPGTFLIVPLAPAGTSGGFPHSASQTVTVPTDQFVTIQIGYDTGIR